MVWNKWSNKDYINYCIDNNLNLPIQKYIDNNTKIYHVCNLCGMAYLINPKGNKRGYKCGYCSGKAIKNINILWNYCNALNFDLPKKMQTFNSLHNKIWFICRKCNRYYYQTITSHIRQHQGCPYCANNIKDTIESHIIKCKKLGLDLPLKGEKYINDSTKMKYRCKNNHVYTQSPGKHIRLNQGCPVCNESHGEKFIRKYLDRHNIKYISQKRFKDLKDKTYLSYDFYLPNYNMLIEYQGIQHYESINFRGNGKYSNLASQKLHDKLKREYAKDNGYKLLCIPYTFDTYKDIENYINNELLI